MSAKTLYDIIKLANRLQQTEQVELAEFARALASRRLSSYELSTEEKAGVLDGLAQAQRGEFVSELVMQEAGKRHGV